MRTFAAALVLDLLGAATALLVSLRTWQTITIPRQRPQPDVVVAIAGRTVDGAVLALSLVALAGVVAVLATRGPARRVVGVVLALAGAGLTVRALGSSGSVSASTARRLAAEQHRAASLGDLAPRVEVHAVWPVLCAVGGLLVLVAGLVVAWRGQTWRAMSARYESAPGAPSGASVDRATDSGRAATAMWSALDRGDDPTAR